jgi:hypothetical protein
MYAYIGNIEALAAQSVVVYRSGTRAVWLDTEDPTEAEDAVERLIQGTDQAYFIPDIHGSSITYR